MSDRTPHGRKQDRPARKRGIERGGAHAPMILRALALASALAVATTMALADAAERYVAPGGAFSIALTDPTAPTFRRGRESVSDQMIFADFPFENSNGLAMSSSRTVEWIKLDKPVDLQQLDVEATALVEGYLEGRYGAGKYTVGGGYKFRAPDGRLAYVFAATTTLDEMPARWQGVVQFYDRGIALVCEIVPQPALQHTDPGSGIVSQPAVDWALTLRPGP